MSSFTNNEKEYAPNRIYIAKLFQATYSSYETNCEFAIVRKISNAKFKTM